MRPYLVGHTVAIIALSCGLSGCAVRTTPNPQAIEDALTAARVRTALVNDPHLGPRAIEVRVTAGVAHVTGGGFTEEEAARLQHIIRAVAGVTAVEATVEIAAPPRDRAPGLALVGTRPPG